MGFWTKRTDIQRQPETEDLVLFEQMVREKFADFNWFSFNEQDAKNGSRMKYALIFQKIYIPFLLQLSKLKIIV